MTWMNVVAMFVWTGVGALLLFGLMFLDSVFTKYKDITEIKNGNVAVTLRFVMKLYAQGYILSQAIIKSNDLWLALLMSAVSFVILFILEMIVEIVLKSGFALNLAQGTQEGKVAYALLSGSLHVVGALILGAL